MSDLLYIIVKDLSLVMAGFVIGFSVYGFLDNRNKKDKP